MGVKITISFGEINGIPVKRSYYLKNPDKENIEKVIFEINGLSNILGMPEPVVEYGDNKLVSLINKEIDNSASVSYNLSRPLKKLVCLGKEKKYVHFVNIYSQSFAKQKNKIYIGFDIGGTFIKSAAFRNSKIINGSYHRISAPAQRNKAVSTLVRLFIQMTDGFDKDKIAGIGVGIPGFSVNGTIIKMGNLPSWKGLPIADGLSKEIFSLLKKHVPVWMNNDANLSGLRNSIKLKKPNSITLTIGTGIGGGIIIDGKIFHGESGAAGEMHFILPNSSKTAIRCNCGIEKGCLESLCSSRGIVVRMANSWQDLVTKEKSDILARIVDRVNNRGGIKDDDCRKIAELAVAGNLLALKVFKETAKLFFEAMKYLNKITGINEYIFAGGVVQEETGKLLQRYINTEIKKCGYEKILRLTLAEDQNTAGAEGAAIFAETMTGNC